ncbi:MAG: hypothetical protein JWR16_244 [Nevskia sp.]|nr:hypothetical protein [Nevskia sp.]
MKYAIWIVVVLALAAGGYYWWRQQHPPAPAAVEVPSSPAAAGEAAIQHPIEQAQTETPPASTPTPLPALGDSDSAAQDALKDLFGAKALLLFYLNDVIRRIVATVDNLPRDKVALRLMPLKPVPGRLVVGSFVDGMALADENALRYAAYVQLVDALSAPKLVAVYVHFYPLFQQAYQDLGYPKGYFNDRLVLAIDNLLATPELAQPIRLQQPSVLYQFADPDLEARSAGQKMLLRMGRDNAAIVKRKLREIRHALVADAPQPADGH